MRVVRPGRPQGTEQREVLSGRAVDLTDEGHSPDRVRNAIRGNDAALVSIDCADPSRWWTALAVPTDDRPPLDRVVAAARTRGVRVAEERSLAAAQRELAALSTERVDPAAARRRLADVGEDVERLKEEVATTRGRLQALRRVDGDTDAAENALADAVERLSEAETERLAAEQALEAAERQARRARSLRERRLRLEDRVANRRRDVRRALVRELVDPFAEAVREVPGEAALSADPLRVTGDATAAALVAVRLADLQAPVVDATGRFDSADAAASALEVPVVRC